jgi:hypothetical protein
MSEEAGAPQSIEQVVGRLPPDFAFFSDAFRNSVCPALQAKETERVAAVKRQQMFTIYGVIAFFVLGLAVQLIFQNFYGWIGGVAAGSGLYAWGSSALSKLGAQTKLMLIDPIASQFQMAYQLTPFPQGEMQRFRNLGLVGGWDRSKYEDELTGKRGDAPFQFYEAHLEEKRTTTDSKGRTRTTWVTIFKGQCLVVKFHKQFNGVTKVYRDAGAFNFLKKFGVREPRVKLEDPVFEKQFEVYGSDQIEARFILTPDFMERLLKLERAFSGRQLRCAFAEGEMLLCVEGKNLFEAGSMHRKMDDLNRVQEMLQDFAAMFLLIDSMSQRLTPDALRGTQI